MLKVDPARVERRKVLKPDRLLFNER